MAEETRGLPLPDQRLPDTVLAPLFPGQDAMHSPFSPRAATGPVAVVSHTLPGDLNGQAVMLDRLTSGSDGLAAVFVDTDRKARPRPPRADGARVHPAGTPFALRKLFRFTRLHRQLYHMLVRQRSRVIAEVVREHGCRAIIGCTGGDLVDLPAAVEAGRMTGIPAFLYYFDDYRMQWEILGGRWGRWVAPRLRDLAEPMVLERAAGVIVPNETLADDVRQRTTLPVTVIRNPLDTMLYDRLRQQFPRRPLDPSKPLRIVYTGSVYTAQADALQRLCEAIAIIAAHGIRAGLHVYGHEPCPDVRRSLPVEQITFHPPVSTAESAGIQVQADVLFLPLSFTCEYPALIRTSAPGKFGEYLASGTPVVVHAPADSFPVSFVARHACAAACAVPDCYALARTLVQLVQNDAGREAMVARAITVAEDFSVTINRKRLTSFVQGMNALALRAA